MKLRHTTLSRVRTNSGATLRWIVTTDTGYRAELPACPCSRIPCTRVKDHPVGTPQAHKGDRGSARRAALRAATDEHRLTHCHAMFGQRHKAQAVKFAELVDATYPKRKTKQKGP